MSSQQLIANEINVKLQPHQSELTAFFLRLAHDDLSSGVMSWPHLKANKEWMWLETIGLGNHDASDPAIGGGGPMLRKPLVSYDTSVGSSDYPTPFVYFDPQSDRGVAL